MRRQVTTPPVSHGPLDKVPSNPGSSEDPGFGTNFQGSSSFQGSIDPGMPPTHLTSWLRPDAQSSSVRCQQMLRWLLLLLLLLLCDQLSVHLAAGACFRLHQITIHGTSSPSAVYVGLVGCFAHVMSYHGHGVVSHGRRRCQSTVSSDSTGLYRTVLDYIDCTRHDARPAVSCRCLMPCLLGETRMPCTDLHAPIITQRTPRAPAWREKTLSIRVQL